MFTLVCFSAKMRPQMQERPDFEFPRPAPGHSLLLERLTLARIGRLTAGALKNEPPAEAWIARVVMKTLWYLDKQSGSPDTIEMLALREIRKRVPENQILQILPEAAQKGKKLYDGCFIRTQQVQNEARNPFLQQLFTPETPKKIEPKKQKDYSKLNIKVFVPEDELRQTIVNSLPHNKPMFLQEHPEFEEAFIKLVLSLAHNEIVPHSKMKEIDATPEFMEKYTLAQLAHCRNRLKHVSKF